MVKACQRGPRATAGAGPRQRHPPGRVGLQATMPVTPVGEADDRALPDAEHLPQRERRVIHEGQRLAEHHIVEAAVRVVAQPLGQVSLAYAQPAAHARQHARLAQFDAAAFDALVLHQIVEERAVAAPQVEQPRRAGDNAMTWVRSGWMPALPFTRFPLPLPIIHEAAQEPGHGVDSSKCIVAPVLSYRIRSRLHRSGQRADQLFAVIGRGGRSLVKPTTRKRTCPA